MPDTGLLWINIEGHASFIEVPACFCHLFSQKRKEGKRLKRVTNLLIYVPANQVTFQITEDANIYIAHKNFIYKEIPLKMIEFRIPIKEIQYINRLKEHLKERQWKEIWSDSQHKQLNTLLHDTRVK
jgi:hypothetical protein